MEFKNRPYFDNPRYLDKKHKKELNTRTKTWGTVKFKPQPYRSNKPAFTPPDPQATAKPWQHVKNDIIDDSEELSHASRLNVDSEDAKQFMQQREQNHRRNIIETNRSEPTKWETFDDEQQQPSTSNKAKKREKEKSKFWQCDKSKGELPTDAKNFTFKERNFFRRKLTMGLTLGGVNLESAINDLKKNNKQLQAVATNSFNTKDHNRAEKVESNPVPKSSNPFQNRKPFQKGAKPFQKGRKPFQKKRKGKKSWEE